MLAFARVVEARSFTKAAEKLGVSKSVVSARVAGLERALDVKLLHRTTRKLSLTPEGTELYERCLRVVAAAEEAMATRNAVSGTPRGLLRINAPIVFAEDYLAEPLAQYLDCHPNVQLELDLSDRVVDLVQDGIDLAIRITSRLAGPGLVAKRLATDQPVLCAAPSYLARRGRPRTPADVAEHDCLVYTLLRVNEEWRFRARGEREALSVGVNPRFSAASGAMLRRAAVAGMGLAVLPRFMVASDLAAGRLEIALDSLFAPTLGIYAVYPQARRVPAKVRALVDLLSNHFATARW